MKILKMSSIAIFVIFFVLGGCQPETSPLEAPTTQPNPPGALGKIALPKGSVTSAILWVYQINSNAGFLTTAHQITAPWDEMLVTWNSFGGKFETTPSGSYKWDGLPGWHGIDITGLVQGWVDGTITDYGVLLKQATAGQPYTEYYSSEWGAIWQRPKLDVWYNLGNGPVNVFIQRGSLGNVADAYIMQLLPDANRGKTDDLFTGMVCLQDPPVCTEKYSLLKFDLPPICAGTIGDLVWEDKNNNTSYEPGIDVPLPGVVITLKDANGNVIGTQTTIANGFYSFTNLCPGEYSVCYEKPVGYSELMSCTTATDNSTNNNNHCNCIPVTLDGTPNNPNIDFGFRKGTDYCPPTGFGDCPSPVGRLFTSVNGNGDLVVTYQQFGINDNTYGTGAAWSHTFSNLTGSDKAQFIFRNGSGNVVLDFKCDYLSAKPGTPSGYGSLGATGGDGSMTTGNVAWIVSATTSLDDNLNKFGYCVSGNCSGGGTNLLVNSPATDANFTPNPTYPKWDFINSYTVVISKNAFGGSLANFGSVTIGEVHNSPHRCGGSNAIIPIPCVGAPPSPCDFSWTTLPITDRLVKVSITNTGPGPLVLSRVAISWPTANGKLKKIKLDGDVLYDIVTNPPSVDVSTFKPTDPNKYTVKAGETDQLIFEFEKNAALTGYVIDVEFGGDCKFQVNL